MAWDDAYATIQDYRNNVERTNQTQDEMLRSYLKLASRYLDKELHQSFNKSIDLEDRFYMPVHRGNPRAPYLTGGLGYAETENPWLYLRADPNLDIDPLYSAEDLEISVDTNRDGGFTTVLGPTDFQLLPRNNPSRSEPHPYYRLMLTWFSPSTNAVWLPYAEVKVTGYWGWPAVPEAIKAATIELAAIWLFESPRATMTIDELNRVVRASPNAQNIVERVLRVYDRKVLTTGF